MAYGVRMLKLRHMPALIAIAVCVSAAAPRPNPVAASPLQQLEERVQTIEQAEDTEVRENERADLAAQQSMGDSAQKMLWPAWLQGITGTLGVAGVIGSLIFSTMTHRQNQLSSERQLRAYLGITGVTFADVEPGKRLRALLNTKNFGQTPAYNVQEELTIEIFKNGDVVTTVPTEVGGGLCINPGADFGTFQLIDEPLSDAQHAQITSVPPNGDAPEYVVRVAGRTTYTDAFKVQRHIYYDSAHWGAGLGRHVLAKGKNYVT